MKPKPITLLSPLWTTITANQLLCPPQLPPPLALKAVAHIHPLTSLGSSSSLAYNSHFPLKTAQEDAGVSPGARWDAVSPAWRFSLLFMAAALFSLFLFPLNLLIRPFGLAMVLLGRLYHRASIPTDTTREGEEERHTKRRQRGGTASEAGKRRGGEEEGRERAP